MLFTTKNIHWLWYVHDVKQKEINQKAQWSIFNQYIGKLENGTSILAANSTQRNNVTFFDCPTWKIRYPFIAGSAEVAFDSTQTFESSEFQLWISIWRTLVRISICHTEYFSWHHFHVFHLYPTACKKEHNQEKIQKLWIHTFKGKH